MATSNLPVYAGSAPTGEEFLKIKLSAADLKKAVGGSGHVDASMADYQQGGTQAAATFTNRTTTLTVNYELKTITSNGALIEILDSGTLAPGHSILSTGTPTPSGTSMYVQARIWSGGFGAGFQSIDTSWAATSLDTDGDGILDVDEIANGLNPNDPTDAQKDFDRDFVSNIDEINVHGTDPNSFDAGLAPDADNDGVTDVVEVALGTDPNTADSIGGDTPALQQAMHVINRLSYGPTNAMLTEVMQKGTAQWISEQLTPIGLDENPPDPGQALRDAYPTRNLEIERVGPMRPLHTTNQLQTRMSLFWDNHFNTYIQKVARGEEELYEEDLFFVNALGNFNTLLDASAKSYAMLHYLDLRFNTASGPNENYPREVVELHTLGETTADGNYTAADVAELARILTGWGVTTSPTLVSRYGFVYDVPTGPVNRPLLVFNFNSGNHDSGAKTFMGVNYPAGAGQAEGDAALSFLANHDSTATNICTKLSQHFISDAPLPATISSCKSVYLANTSAPNQIQLVLNNLFNSAEFNDPANHRAKFKDGMEYLFALGRLLGWSAIANLVPGDTLNGTVFGERTQAINHHQYNKPEPTGWPEVSSDWINTNSVLGRFREGNKIVFDNGQTNLVGYFTSNGLTTTADILANLFTLMLGAHYDTKHLYMAYFALGLENGGTFALADPDAESKLKGLVARIAQLPEYNLH